MADPQIDSAPQAFTFGSHDLKGRLTKFSGSTKRRSVDHVFPKRDGGVVEDMGRGQFLLSVQLVFTGPTCAADYQEFKKDISDNPRGLLVHPIAGRWNAYTEGPNEDVDFARAFDEIQVRCDFKEDNLDETIDRDAPNPATAAQNVTAQQSKFQATVAGFMGSLAKAELFTSTSLARVDAALAQIDQVTAPVDFMSTTIGGVASAGSQAIGKALNIANKTQVLINDVSNYVTAANDLFAGGDVAAGLSTQTDTLLGSIEKSAHDLEDTLIAASPTPAGAADAVGDVEELLAGCLVLADALQAAYPPVRRYVVPEVMDVTTVALRTGPASTAIARVQAILTINRIPNPAAIPRGRELDVPTR